MSREIKFTPETKESVVLDYIKGSRWVIQICNELYISISLYILQSFQIKKIIFAFFGEKKSFDVGKN